MAWKVLILILGSVVDPASAQRPFCPGKVYPGIGQETIKGSIAYDPRPKANTGINTDEGRFIFAIKRNVEVRITRSGREVRYAFWDGVRKSELKVMLPEGIPNDVLPASETIKLGEIPPAPNRQGSRSIETWDDVAKLREWKLEKWMHAELSKLYSASLGRLLEEIDINQAHENVERYRYSQMLSRQETNKLDGRILIPRPIGDPAFLFDLPDFRIGGFLDAFYPVHRYYMRGKSLDGLNPLQFFLKAVSDFGILYKLAAGKVGIGLHVDSAKGTSTDLEIISGEAYYDRQAVIDPFYARLPYVVWNRVFSIYRDRMENVPEEQHQRAEKISRDLLQRSIIVAILDGQNSFAVPFFEQPTSAFDLPGSPRAIITPDQVKGAITAVLSKDANELLPTEILFDQKIHIPRRKKKTLEIGRSGVPRGESPETNLTILSTVVALCNGANDIDQVVAMADDELQMRRLRRKGFSEFVTPETLAAGIHLMVGDPANLKP